MLRFQALLWIATILALHENIVHISYLLHSILHSSLLPFFYINILAFVIQTFSIVKTIHNIFCGLTKSFSFLFPTLYRFKFLESSARPLI